MAIGQSRSVYTELHRICRASFPAPPWLREVTVCGRQLGVTIGGSTNGWRNSNQWCEGIALILSEHCQIPTWRKSILHLFLYSTTKPMPCWWCLKQKSMLALSVIVTWTPHCCSCKRLMQLSRRRWAVRWRRCELTWRRLSWGPKRCKAPLKLTMASTCAWRCDGYISSQVLASFCTERLYKPSSQP